MDVIGGRPTDGLTYDPNNRVYWEREALDQEVERIFEICHGCRLCFNLVPLVPGIIQRRGWPRRRRSRANRRRDRPRHRYLLPVQAVLRQVSLHAGRQAFLPARFSAPFAARQCRAPARSSGIASRARRCFRVRRRWDGFGRPHAGTGQLGRRQPMLRHSPRCHIGIHHEKILPEFQAETFSAWMKKAAGAREGDPSRPFSSPTCFVEHYDAGRSAKRRREGLRRKTAWR